MSHYHALAVLVPAALALAGCDQAERTTNGTAQPRPSSTTGPAGAIKGTPQPAVEPFDLSCTYPIDGNGDTAATVLQRFGEKARRATLPGPEGTELAGIVLWPDRPERRLELVLEDAPRQRITNVLVREAESRWRWQGLGPGNNMAKVVKANGKPFTFWGFGWDYGGYVSDWGGGRLDGDRAACTLSLRLESGPQLTELPEGASGDRAVRSDDPAALRAQPQVSELSLNWP